MLRPHPLAALLLVSFATLPALRAQTTDDLNEGLRLSPDPALPDSLLLSWWGRTGRIYFIEHSDDLFIWRALPAFEAGADAVSSYGFLAPAPDERLFLRVRRISATLAQFQNQDQDQDGLTNATEASAGLNPFARDTDQDGMPDGYEVAFDLDPLVPSGLADTDGDGVPDQEDARPASSAVGRLSVLISTPANNSSL